MRLLFAGRHRKSVEPYYGFLRAVGARGHETLVVLQERDDRAVDALRDISGVRAVELAPDRRDDWADLATLLRSSRDYLQYLQPAYAGARRLRARVLKRLLEQIGVVADVNDPTVSDAGLRIPKHIVPRLQRVAALLEQSVPASPPHTALLRDFGPDVMLVTPLVHFGSAQADIVKAARAEGVLVGMHVFSWDNLSTKGALHVWPDHAFVWNETQRHELATLHGFATERVTTVGATRFDDFIALPLTLSWESYHAAFSLPTGVGTLLYLCSSKLVSDDEWVFLRRWIAQVRAARHPLVSEMNIVIRPHPDVPAPDESIVSAERRVRWAAGGELRICELNGDPRTVFVRTDRGAAGSLKEMLSHCDLVVGLNTSAEIEAAIVGRPVFTVLTEENLAAGQQGTLHFKQIHASEGGFVQVAPSLEGHVKQLLEARKRPPDRDAIRARAAAFVRPYGWSRPVADVLADAVEQLATRRGMRQPSESIATQAKATTDTAGLCDRRDARVTFAGHEVAVDADLLVAAQADIAGARAVSAQWFCDAAGTGETVYDIGAGIGVAAIVTARLRGATVMAFEAAIPSVHALWRLVLTNGCQGAVVPLPLLTTDRVLLRQELLSSSSAGATRATPRRQQWREHTEPWSAQEIQPVLALPLDLALRTWDLRTPTVMRVALGDAAVECLSGARDLCTSPQLRVVVLQTTRRLHADAAALLQRAGFQTREEVARGSETCSRWTR